MARILVLYYSTYEHVETLAHAVAEGARARGAHVILPPLATISQRLAIAQTVAVSNILRRV